MQALVKTRVVEAIHAFCWRLQVVCWDAVGEDMTHTAFVCAGGAPTYFPPGC